MSVVRGVGRGIADRVLEACAAVSARWLDLRSTVPLAVGDFKDRLLDLTEGIAAVPGALRDRATIGQWIRFRVQGISEAVLELPAALARSGSTGLERLRVAAAGAGDHRIFDVPSKQARVAAALGVFCSILLAAVVGVGFGGQADATALGAVPAASASALPEGLRPLAPAPTTRELPASASRRTVKPGSAPAVRAMPVALRAPTTLVKSGARVAGPKTRPSSRPTRPAKPRRGPTAPPGGSGSAPTPSSPAAPTAEAVHPSIGPADTAPSAGDTSSGKSQSSSEPKQDPKPKPKPEPKPAPQPPPAAPVATPPDQPKGTDGDQEGGDGDHQGAKGKSGEGKKSGDD